MLTPNSQESKTKKLRAGRAVRGSSAFHSRVTANLSPPLSAPV